MISCRLTIKDVIVEIEGTAISSTSRLMEIIASRKPGDELDLVIQRDGKRRSLTVKLQGQKQLQGVG